MTLQNDSVRAEIKRGDVRILDVQVKTYRPERVPEAKARKLRAELRTLKDRRQQLRDRLGILNFRKRFLRQSMKSFLKGDSGSSRPGAGSGNARTVRDYDEMLNYLTRKLRENSKEIFREKMNRRKLYNKIRRVQSELRTTSGGRSARRKMIKVTTQLERRGTIAMEISYINFRARWKPAYDVRVVPGEKTMRFKGYGIVSQSSGEDWSNVKLSFSTARPSLSGQPPELKPMFGTVVSGTSSRNTIHRRNLTRRRKAGKTGSLVFRVPRRTNIKGDGSPHRTRISRVQFPVSFEYLTIPRLSSQAYLQAIGKNTMKEPILTGALNIFIKDNFVGSSSTGNILPGEKFELTLSVNEKIRVNHKLEENTASTAGLFGGKRKLKFAYIMKLGNFTSERIIMNVLDQIPVSRSEELEITNPQFSMQPVKRSKDGIIKWRFSLAPAASKTIRFSFDALVPEKKSAAFSRNRRRPVRSMQELDVIEKKMDYNRRRKYRGRRAPRAAPAMKKQMY